MDKMLGASFLILCLQVDWVSGQQKEKSSQEQVKQSPQSLTVKEGEISILNCSYENSLFDYFPWYRQYPGKGPALLIAIRSVMNEMEDGRLTVFHNKSAKQLSLHIATSQPGDSATYFCAGSSPGWGFAGSRSLGYYYVRDETDKLTFGKGTRLIVEPKSQPAASPSVFVMKNGTNVACLVKEFYPKEVTISLQSSKKIIEYEPAIVVSPGGRYSAVKLGQYNDPDSVTCSVEHNKKTWHSSDFEPKKDISETTPKPTESENTTEIQVPATCYEPQVQPGKVNMMSLSVLGLRMLFAKSVAVNFLFTAKLFFF